MSRSLRSITILLFAVLSLAACQSSKHYAKLGAKQEEAGLMHEAAGSYYIALQKKRTNLDAQIGMKKNGQLVLGEMLGEFAKQKNFGTNRSAVDAYHAARDYRDKIKAVGIQLQIADFYESDYIISKSALLTELYESGTTLLEEQKYADAEAKFNEIRALDPNYKDTKELGDIAYLEPLYVQASGDMDIAHYRAAHANFDKIVKRKPTYKDAAMLAKKCIELGTYTIALLPFENASGSAGLDSKLTAYTLEAMTSIDDPFLRVVDREHTQAILEEQKLQLSGVIDENTAVTVGELVGAQALLTGTVLSFTERKGTLRSKQREGYIEYQEKVLNKTDNKYYMQTKYKPTMYTEYYNSNSCTVSFQYKLISLKTGEIIKTEIIEKIITDEVLYGKYDGDFTKLYPAGQNSVNLNSNDRRALQGLMNGRQDLRNTTELNNELFNAITKQMSGQIAQLVVGLVQ